MAGLKRGHLGARVKHIGNSGKFLISGNYTEHQEVWEYLDGLHSVQGAAANVIFAALDLYLHKDQNSDVMELKESLNNIECMLSKILESGVEVKAAETLEAVTGELQAACASFMT